MRASMKSPYPTSLYKYRSFSVRTLRLLAQAEIYYSDPKDFNDPLDCNPAIKVDLERSDLVKLFLRMRVSQLRKTNRSVQEAMATAGSDYNTIFYNAGEYRHPDQDQSANNHLLLLIADEIRTDVAVEMKTHGVLSFSARWNSPLLWSHYADQHRGLCIEYDTSEVPHSRLRAVNYGRPRAINASDLFQWKINNEKTAASVIFNTYFLTKASDWRYEKEWRDISKTIGVERTSYRVKSVTFGLRCDPAVITAIIMLLEGHGSVKFYQIHLHKENFSLERYYLDAEEHRQFGVQSSAILDFNDVFLPED